MMHNFFQDKNITPDFCRRIALGAYLLHMQKLILSDLGHMTKIALLLPVSVAIVTVTPILTLVSMVLVHGTIVSKLFPVFLIFV